MVAVMRMLVPRVEVLIHVSTRGTGNGLQSVALCGEHREWITIRCPSVDGWREVGIF